MINLTQNKNTKGNDKDMIRNRWNGKEKNNSENQRNQSYFLVKINKIQKPLGNSN